MSAFVTSSPKRRMIAPNYMQPRKPVLDAPLDPEGSQRSVVMPAQAAVRRSALAPDLSKDTAPILVSEPILADDAPADSTVYYAELAGQQSVAEQPAQFVAEAAGETVSGGQAAPARKRRKMSVFQQLIVVLLEVAVVMVLATVYLYITGRIDLPPVVVDGIEKGLSLIPWIK